MASQQYISIIRFFKHCDIAIGDDFDLSRARKVAQAEFNIAPEGLIEIDGYVYTRHDVMQEIERPDFLKRLKYHQRIWHCPGLLRLLERSELDRQLVEDEITLFRGDNDFDLFFSPYLALPFSYLQRKLLNEKQFGEAGELLRFEGFLHYPEREEALKPVRIYLDESIRTLRNVNAENYKIMRPKMISWIEEDWSGFFTQLPEELYDRRDQVIVLLINLGVAIQKRHRRDCRKMSQNMVWVENLSESHRGIILSNHEAYRQPKYRVNLGGGFGIVWIVVIVFRAVFAAGSCNSEPRFEYNPIQYNYKDTFSSRMIDSILKGSKLKE